MSPTSAPASSHSSASPDARSAAAAHAGQTPALASALNPSDTFAHRHIGPNDTEVAEMLTALGLKSLDDLTRQTVPGSILLDRPLKIDTGVGPQAGPRGEHELISQLRTIAKQNQVMRSCIGMGYSDCITPPVIQRNILENPGWYTQYTPYQAEISQGRLEALLNFQTMIADLTGLPLAGASLLDEATAAGEAMSMCVGIAPMIDGAQRRNFFVARDCHPQTIAVVQARAEALGIEVTIGDPKTAKFDGCAGALVQYPTTDGRIEDYRAIAEKVKQAGAVLVCAADLLALTLLTPPGEWGAEIVVGSSQRFGVPMGFGGPHAAFIATRSEHARRMPGRIIGVSRDALGNTALRMAIQTREQHIRRDKATSNICTAQALLAIMAGMYAVYHGPEGLRAIAMRVRTAAHTLAVGLRKLGHRVHDGLTFDTIRVTPAKATAADILKAARARGINLRDFGDGSLGIALDETTDRQDLAHLFEIFNVSGAHNAPAFTPNELLKQEPLPSLGDLSRSSPYLTHPVFNTHHSETELLRYIFTLQGRDLSLAHSMIPLGSCTMKLNATSEMIPVTWAEFGRMHPFAPADQTRGYARLFRDLETWLAEITGFAAVSLQPNSGAQGEYAGLLTIRAYHRSRNDNNRVDCLIPTSAHGTNPASAVVAGFRVVPVACDSQGNIDVEDLRAKAAKHKDTLAALMVTYPSTHGVFEESIRDICKIVHDNGGLVYMDGANMNAQVGLCRPGDIGADVCHLNLHKTFCIPHGGGGPGMGPIGVNDRLKPFLPSHPVTAPDSAGADGIGPVAAAPYGSASILPISWVYIALMGADGLKRATQIAILNANYMSKRLEGHYKVLFTGRNGRCAHEFILDCRPFEDSANIKVDDIAKRLMDYGFHGPTMSWPVPGTLMIEPTESEPKSELDRFCDAMIGIREEIRAIEQGKASKDDNVLKGAPHTIAAVSADDWKHAYPREAAAFPKSAPWLRHNKFWPSVARIDNPFGDRNLICTCPPMTEFSA